MDGPGFSNFESKQLRHFDNELTEFRLMYESLDEQERAELRQWLEAES
jgi:hypothetical protein